MGRPFLNKDRPCKACGKKIPGRKQTNGQMQYNKVFCSRSCFMVARNKDRPCKTCGNQILGKKQKNGKTKYNVLYCSISCQVTGQRVYPLHQRRARDLLSRGTILKGAEIPNALVELKILELELKDEAKKRFQNV